MIFFYIDESGTGLKDKNGRYFILSAFATHAREWQRLDKEITILKRSIVSWAKPEDWEIKGRDLRRGDNIFKNYNWAQRSRAFVDIARYLQGFPAYKLINIHCPIPLKLIRIYTALLSGVYLIC